MRCAVLAFAIGILFLEFRSALPPSEVAAGLAVFSLAAAVLHRRMPAPAAWICTWTAAMAFGFAYAAWRADCRLADGLPEAWEGRDIEVVGVVAALPQPFTGGSRFEFVVESALLHK